MIEKPADIAGYIDRYELVNHVPGQPLTGKFARRDGTGRYQHIDLRRGNTLDQRQYTRQFADACCMKPDQWTFGPEDARPAASFHQTRVVFLAAPTTRVKQKRRQGSCRNREQAIRAQGSRQTIAHGERTFPPSAIS